MNTPNTLLGIRAGEPVQVDGEHALAVTVEWDGQTLVDRLVRINRQEEIEQLYADVGRATGLDTAALDPQLGEVILRARAAVERFKRRPASGEAEPSGTTYRPKFLTSADLDALDTPLQWLVEKVLVRGQPALLGGPKKVLKTSLVIDLALSLGTGTPFLGVFTVPQKVRVAVLSGESGDATIRDTARRVAASKRIRLDTADVLWGFDLPRLGVEDDLRVLKDWLAEAAVEVVFIDPAYLCLMGGVRDAQATNMFQVGPLLMAVAKACQEAGATLVLVHHTRKETALRPVTGEPLELDDLAYAGFQEFARQWLLVNRRERFEPGNGEHRLWLTVGGSAGHSGLWGIDVDEGMLGKDFGGRRWSVSVKTADDARKANARRKEEKREESGRAKHEQYKAAVLNAMKLYPEGETISFLGEQAGVPKPQRAAVFAELSDAGAIRPCQVSKSNGKGFKSYAALRPASTAELMANKMEGLRPDLPIAAAVVAKNRPATVKPAKAPSPAELARRKGSEDPQDTDALDEPQAELAG